MALIKSDGYDSLRVETGDAEIDGEEKEQLKVKINEIISAINAENIADRIFARILINRKKSFDTLMGRIPGVKSE